MNYSLDKVNPGLEELPVFYLVMDDIAWYSMMTELHKILPEMKRELMGKACSRCGQGCEKICHSGEAVAWKWTQARFKAMVEWN